MILACLALIVAGNTEFVWGFEHSGLPLSWAFAGGAVLAFVAFEVCDTSSVPGEEEEESSHLSAEWETAKF